MLFSKALILASHLTFAMMFKPRILPQKMIRAPRSLPYHTSTVTRYNDDPDGRDYGAMVSFFEKQARYEMERREFNRQKLKERSVKADNDILTIAIVHGTNEDALRVLEDKDHDINKIGDLGCDALWNALGYMHGSQPRYSLITKLVKKHGADINRRNSFFDDSTMLHWAIYRNDAKTVKFLLGLGADPRAVNLKTGLEPAELAKSLGFMTVSKLIKDKLKQ